MKTLQNTEQETNKEKAQPETVPIFSYELLRDILIPDLLGKDLSEISYWAGKQLARKFPLLSLEENISFFEEAGWGHLFIANEKRNQLFFELNGNMVQRRFHMNPEPCFRLEAGFLAEQIQNMKQLIAEASESVNSKQNKVTIIVQWDKKDSIKE